MCCSNIWTPQRLFQDYSGYEWEETNFLNRDISADERRLPNPEQAFQIHTMKRLQEDSPVSLHSSGSLSFCPIKGNTLKFMKRLFVSKRE